MEPPESQECPFCFSEIPTEAKKCRHCGEWITIPATETKGLELSSANGNALKNDDHQVNEKNKSKYKTKPFILKTLAIISFLIGIQELVGLEIHKYSTISAQVDGIAHSVSHQVLESLWNDDNPYFRQIQIGCFLFFVVIGITLWVRSNRVFKAGEPNKNETKYIKATDNDLFFLKFIITTITAFFISTLSLSLLKFTVWVTAPIGLVIGIIVSNIILKKKKSIT